MATDGERNSRPPRKRGIPRSFIQSWQCPGMNGIKPPARRPMTACEACRAAKVKCNGQRVCGRCTSRGLVCRYASPAYPDKPGLSQGGLSRTVADISPPEELSVDGHVHLADPFPLYDEDPFGTVLDRPPEGLLPRVDEHFDWAAIDINVDEHISDAAIYPSPPEAESLSSGRRTAHANSTTTAHAPTALSDSSASESCSCIPSLMLLSPKIQHATRGQLHDAALQVTGDIINRCQRIIDCTTCRIGGTDLIWMLAVFQQTYPCFKTMTTAEKFGAIKLSVGEYEMAIGNDSELRRILVMDLVRQARAVLDSFHSLGQNVFSVQSDMCALREVNLAYLQSTIEEFRKLLLSVTHYFSESRLQPTTSLEGNS
ncbi:hypothetical protein BDW62DRAFT_202948 [Aspergillus aurantiobrunneus]